MLKDMNTAAPTESIPVSASVDHRTSCHRCGNIRKNLHKCTECPQVFCSRCTEKMMEEHGSDIFFNGCPMVSIVDSFFCLNDANVNELLTIFQLSAKKNAAAG